MGNVDSIPVLSQVKSLVQVMAGDAAGARRTQENFIVGAPVVSQMTSAVLSAMGKHDQARQVQEKFVHGLDVFTDSLPGVGHIKGAIYYATGDDEKGEMAMKSATGSLVSAAGFMAGGPAGGLAASQLYDGVVSGVDTAIHGSPQYYGSWDTFDRMHQGVASVGEVFDTVGMMAVDSTGASLGAKFGKSSPHFAGIKRKEGTGLEMAACRGKRDVSYHLTSSEAEFVTSHQKLPGSVSEVLNANWQSLDVSHTVSNLVSLFIILRLILWDDRSGRSYSQELCSQTADPMNVDRCQEALMKTLRRMEDHLTSNKEDENFVLNPDIGRFSGVHTNSTLTMIRSMMTLYGVLGSIGRADKMGIKWLIELCLYEDMGTYRICKKEVLQKLKQISHTAFHLGEARKRRIKRSGIRCLVGKVRPFLKTMLPKTVRGNVDFHKNVVKLNKEKIGSFESNHVPALSTYDPKVKPPGRNLVAHSLPKDTHQIAMTKVGTSKNSKVSKALRKYEHQLQVKGNMADAIKLDMTASYGRANVLMDKDGNTQHFKPALVEYSDDMHAIVDKHRLTNAISSSEAKSLHKFIDTETNFWTNNKPTWEAWLDRMEEEYKNIVEENELTLEPGGLLEVPESDRHFG